MKKIVILSILLLILSCTTTKDQVAKTPVGSDEFIQSMETWDNSEKKINLLEQVLQLDPDNPIVYYYIAEELKEMDKLDKAIEALNKAIKLDPYFSSAYILRGGIKLWYLDDKTGVEDFKQAYIMNPKSLNAALEYGSNTEWETRELQKDFYIKLVEQFPDNSEVLAELAFVYHLENDHIKVIETINRAIELNPQDSYLHHKKGYYYKSNGDYLLAEEALKEALSISSDNSYFKVFLATILRHMNRIDEALVYLKQSADEDWVDDGLYTELIRVESRMGIFDNLEFYSQQIVEESWSYYFNGVISLRTGDFEQALSLIKQARDLEDWNSEFQLSLAYLYLKLGNIDMSNEIVKDMDIKELTSSNWYSTYELYYDLIKDIENGSILESEVPAILLLEK